MRVVLIGRPRSRARLRASLADVDIEVAGEAASIREARSSTTADIDAFVVAPEAPEEGLEARAADPDRPEVPDEPLTPREHDVLELVAEGLSNKAIGARLGISDQTVKFHVASICGKLGVANRTEA
ncbi:MAG TPA: helix-turn-helix transcriptional regulator, partial [Vicinamibacterales bacterium]